MKKQNEYSKICVISAYFGKLPDYFDLWLNSCKYNETIDFLIFTDDKTNYDIPSNVRVEYTNLENIKTLIQKLFDFKISLEYAYKLCDYKPVYGYIFKDYLNGYDFWGHCDLDVIFGDLRKYLDNDILNNNDKILPRGHFTLYKNESRVNENFKELIDLNTNKPLYKKVFTSNSSFYFDEWTGIIKLYDGKKYKMYRNEKAVADISIKYNNLIVTSYKKSGKAIFKWETKNSTSKLYGFFLQNDILTKEEFMYIHLQKRKMKKTLKKFDKFYIVPNEFINSDKNISKKVFKNMNNKITVVRKEYIIMKFKRLYQKIFRKGKKI